MALFNRIHQDDLRIIAALTSMLIAGIVLTVLSFGPAPDSVFAIVMLDRQSPLYPMTVQNLLYFMFALGIGESYVRFYSTVDARRQIDKNLLAIGREQLLSDDELQQLSSASTQLSLTSNHRRPSSSVGTCTGAATGSVSAALRAGASGVVCCASAARAAAAASARSAASISMPSVSIRACAGNRVARLRSRRRARGSALSSIALRISTT